MLHPGGLRVAKNAKQPPANIAVDIVRATSSDQETAAFGFLNMEQTKADKATRQEEAARFLQEIAAVALAEAIEAARPKKAPDAPSRHGGFQERALQMVPVGGASMKYSGSLVARLVEEEAEMLASRISPSETTGLYGATIIDHGLPERPVGVTRETGDRGSISFLDSQAGLDSQTEEGGDGGGEGGGEATDAQPRRSSLDSMYPNLQPPGTDGHMPVAIPPRTQRMSHSVPKDVYGNDRGGKVMAPEVSLAAAAANPNMRNLLLEVPYKRGVRTTSINQRYLTHEQTFDAAFELLPSEANFGTLKAGSLYRLKLKLVNVSSLPQRFRFEAHGPAAASGALKVVYTPGVAAAGMSMPVEVEVASAEPLEIHEIVTAVTEREEISLPISAHILADEAYGEYIATSASRKGPLAPRLVSASLRSPELHKTLSIKVGDASAGALRGLAPKTRGRRPDFFAEPKSDGEPESEDEGGE